MKVEIRCLFFSRVSVVLVLDLSKPNELWNTLEVFIKQVCMINFKQCMYVYAYMHTYIHICIHTCIYPN